MRDRSSPLTSDDLDGLAWAKQDGLLPAVVQDASTARVLMLGYMSREALAATLDSGFVTFFSRSKGRLWQKGETSGNRLAVAAVHVDCDDDALLVLARPAGPTCHLGTTSCFAAAELPGPAWLGELERIVSERAEAEPDTSYTARLLAAGLPRIAQKVGEEGVETALAAVTGQDAELTGEVADLLYHLTVLLQARSLDWSAVMDVLRRRHAEPGCFPEQTEPL